MNNFAAFDYLICAVGVATTIEAIGLLGNPLPVLHGLLFFASLSMGGYFGILVVLNSISDYLPLQQRRRFILFTSCNLMPLIVIIVKHWAG